MYSRGEVLGCVAQRRPGEVATTGVEQSFQTSQKRSVCCNARAVLGKLQVAVEGDWRVCRSGGETGAMEEGQTAKGVSMLGEYCAAQVATTEGIDTDVEIG